MSDLAVTTCTVNQLHSYILLDGDKQLTFFSMFAQRSATTDGNSLLSLSTGLVGKVPT